MIRLAGGAADSRAALILQAVIGSLLLLYAFLAPSKPNAARQKKREDFLMRAMRPRLLFGFGMYVTAIELITALPYFAALALLANANLPLVNNIAILKAYCLIFVTPPLVVAYIYYRNRTRFDAWLRRSSGKNKQRGRETVLWLMGVVGLYALVHALFELGIIRPS